MNYSRDISAEEFERIENFLNKQMSAEETAAFETELENDEKLLDKVAAVKLLFLGINEQTLKENLDKYHSNLSKDGKASKKMAPVYSLSRRFLVAASVVAVIGLGVAFWLTQKPTTNKLYSNYFKPDPGLATMMSSVSNYKFQKAMVEYKEGKYEQALRAWNDLLKQQPGKDTLIYFIGAAYQANRQEELAISNLKLIADDRSSAFQKDACWYLGLIYLKLGNMKEAVNYIQQSGHEGSDQIIQAINKK